MVLKMIFLFVVLLGLIYSLKYGNKKSGIITVGLALSVFVALITSEMWNTIGVIMYMVLSLTVLVYGFQIKGFSKSKRMLVCLTALPILLYWLFALNHLPGLNMLRFILFVPIISFFVSIGKKDEMKPELGFLLIFAVDAVSIIAESWLV